MNIPLLLLVLGALWVWLGFNMHSIRDRHFPMMSDWVPLFVWFLLLIVPVALAALNAGPF